MRQRDVAFGVGLSVWMAAAAGAMPAAGLSGAFSGLESGLSIERSGLQQRRALEDARQAAVDGALVLQAGDEAEPIAVVYEETALEKVEALRAELSDDPADLQQKASEITSEDFSGKTVRLYVDLSTQRARLVYPGGETTYPISSGNARIAQGVWTARGYFDVDRDERGGYRVYKMWHSKKLHDAPMPDSLFFHNGEAAHAAVGSEIAQLGTGPHSHGCVRMPPKMASFFRALALQEGPGQVGIYVYGEEPGRGASPALAARPAPKPARKPAPPSRAPVGAPLNILPFSFGR